MKNLKYINNISQKRQLIFTTNLLIIISFILFLPLTLNADIDPDKDGYYEDSEFRFKAYIPRDWDKEINKKEQSLRLELFSSPRTFIITEVYKDFTKNIYDYKDVIWRRQKIKFHTLEKIIDRNFEKEDAQIFLMISRFWHKGTLFLQRTYGKQIGESAYILNFIAPKNQFYKKLPVFNTFVSRFKFNISTNGSEEKNSGYDESKFEEDKSEENKKIKSAKDLLLDEKKEGSTATTSESNKTDKSEEEKNKTFTLLPDGSWGFQ